MTIKNKKKRFIVLLTGFLGIGIFFLAMPAQADGKWATYIFGGLISLIIGALGLILVLVMQALVAVAQYSNFIHAPAISNGWSVVRDVCNMFFVLILLIIAFATILRVENYSYKKWLPKLILMAILINFSKTICGLLIDFAQIVMLTFVNAFKDMAAGNLITNLGITEILTLANDSGHVSAWEIVGAYVLGLIYILIALVVIITMLAMLVMRIVMIWIYVVLSPAAYLMSAFPGGQKYSSQWWTEFSKNLIVGPVLAFFIWLSFVSLQTQNIYTDFPTTGPTDTAGVAGEVGVSMDGTPVAGSEASTPGVFIKFIIAIGMLVGGLKISQEIGGAAGGIAGKGMSKITKGAAFAGGLATGALAFGGKKIKQGAANVGSAVGRSARNQSLGVASWASKGIGGAINKRAGGNTRVGDAMLGVGNIGSAWRTDMIMKNKKKKQDNRQKFLEKIGMGEKTMDKTSEFLKTDTGKALSTAMHGGGVGAAVGSFAGPVGTAIGGIAGFALGGGASVGAGKLAASSKATQERRLRQADAIQSKADTLQAQADASNDPADIKRAKKYQKLAKKARNAAGWSKSVSETAGGFQEASSQLTQKAATKGSLDIKNARKQIGVLSADPTAMEGPSGFTGATFYNKSGQTAQQKKFFEQLTNKDNPESAQAVSNMAAWASTIDTANPKEMEKLESLARGIAAFKKGKGDTSNLSGLIASLNAKSTIGTVDSLDNKVIANRKTGAIGEKGSGAFEVDSFAKNKDNISGKNVVGVDFNKMQEAGLDSEAEASIATGTNIGPIAQALSAQIAAEKAELLNAKSSGDISESDFNTRNASLDKAQTRLSNPDELKNLNLINTASANYGRQEKMASVYHEEIHAGGVDDEDLTEGMSKKLMSNKLYGRNAATGGRHATEIAKQAKSWKDQGMSNDDILSKVDNEIKTRVGAEGKSRAERVANLEKGNKETESQAVGNIEEIPALNTEVFQKSLDTLSEKVKKMASSIKPMSGSSANSAANNNLLFPLKQLNLNMRKNVSTMQALSKKTGGQAPTTIVEAGAINDELNS